MTPEDKPPALRPLCSAWIELAADAPIPLGRSPWRNRRVSDIAGGRFFGQRLAGRIRASGADWSEGGVLADGTVVTLVDVRSVWTTDDGADVYVTYSGRLVIPPKVLDDFRDPARVEQLSPDAYRFRIVPTFETASADYAWLNEIVAVGVGRRTAAGVEYAMYEVT